MALLNSTLCKYNLDIMCVTETWLSGEVFPTPINYSMYRCDRKTRGGGVAAFVKKGIKANVLLAN